jgi:hypothetical protein
MEIEDAVAVTADDAEGPGETGRELLIVPV